MAGIYTFLACDLVTNTVLAELPLLNVSFENKLNDAGTLTGLLLLSDPKVQQIAPLSATQPGRTALYVDRNGRLVWGGIIWTRRYNNSNFQLEIQAQEFWSYFQHRLIVYNAVFLAQDELAYARWLVTYAQSLPGGNIGIQAGKAALDGTLSNGSNIVTSASIGFASTDNGCSIACSDGINALPLGTTISSVDSATQVHVSNAAQYTSSVLGATNTKSPTGSIIAVAPSGVGIACSGVYVDQKFNDYELKDIHNVVQQLSSLQYGYDFDIDVAYDSNGLPAKYLTLSWPRRGLVLAQGSISGPVFDLPGNVMDYQWPEDGTKMMNSVQLYGAGAGNVMIRSSASDTSLIDAGYPLLEGAVSYKEQSNQSILDKFTRAQLNAYKNPVLTPVISVNPLLDPVLGSYTVGDDCRVMLNDYRFAAPNQLDTFMRIINIKVAPQSDAAVEKVDLTLSAPFTS